MIIEKAVERSLAIVDRALRQSFPDDYHKRCMYAAFGLQAMLKDLGFEPDILGGDMLAFMVSRSERQGGMQGFAGSVDGHAHYWLEVEGRLVDVGPHYLPRDADYPAATVPFVSWSIQEPLPPFLRYRIGGNFGSKTVLLSDEIINERMDKFVAICRRKLKGQVGQPKPPYWVLSGTASLLHHGAEGDPWVRNAMRFATMREAVAGLPF